MIGLGGYHLADRAIRKRAFGLFAQESMKELTFWITAGTTTEEKAKFEWAKPCATVIARRRFLMTKIDGRTKTAAAAQLNESLRRLQTDRIDLLQFHEVIRDSDPDRIFAEGGGMEAVLEAQEGGQGPFYRLHRPQESRHSFEDAGHSLKARLQVRCRSDASQRDGRSLQQFRKESASGFDRERYWRSWHETHGRPCHP